LNCRQHRHSVRRFDVWCRRLLCPRRDRPGHCRPQTSNELPSTHRSRSRALLRHNIAVELSWKQISDACCWRWTEVGADVPARRLLNLNRKRNCGVSTAAIDPEQTRIPTESYPSGAWNDTRDHVPPCICARCSRTCVTAFCRALRSVSLRGPIAGAARAS
jgi:hypothetical protein